jgi:hypothetical protein
MLKFYLNWHFIATQYLITFAHNEREKDKKAFEKLKVLSQARYLIWKFT